MLEIFNDLSATPSALIDAVKILPGMAGIYETRVRHYILEDHTKLVLSQFDQYFKSIPLPLDRHLFRFLLTIHDLGKPAAEKAGNRSGQYIRTAELVRQFKPSFPFSDQDIELCLTIIGGDPLGLYLQGKLSLTTAVDSIRSAAAQTAMAFSDFFRALTIYYQCDAAAYTQDAGGLPFLERVFEYKDHHKVLDKKRQILQFSRIFESKFGQLETALA